MGNKLIYEFSGKKTDGDASLNNLLGGKGANLAEMSKLGIQVPPGFTITTEVCSYFSENKKLPDGLKEEIIQFLLMFFLETLFKTLSTIILLLIWFDFISMCSSLFAGRYFKTSSSVGIVNLLEIF